MEYLDFEVWIGPRKGTDYPVSVTSPAGSAEGTMKLPYDAQALKQQLETLETAVFQSAIPRRDLGREAAIHDGPTRFGTELFKALFTDDVREKLRISQSKAKDKNKGLRVRLRIEAPDLSSLPWEFLYDPKAGDFVCLSTETPVVRYLEVDDELGDLTVEPPISILAVASCPSDLDKLDVEKEKQRLEEATADMVQKNRLSITWLQGSTYDDVQRALYRGKYHVLHFVGHGGFDDGADEGMLALTNEEGAKALYGAKDIARLVHDHATLRLVVLNSCLGARGSSTSLFSSSASALVRRGVPAVVAMQYVISDHAAIVFSRSLYQAVFDGMPIDAAVALARKSVSASARNSVEWGTPVLYMRSPNGVLFNVDKSRTGSHARPQLLAPTLASAQAPGAGPAVVPTPMAFAPPPQAGGATSGSPSTSRRNVILAGVGAVFAIAASVGAYIWSQPGPVVEGVSLTSSPKTIVREGEGTVVFRLELGDAFALGNNVVDVLRKSGDSVRLMTSDTTVLKIDHGRSSGTFSIIGRKEGPAAIWPVIVRPNGEILAAKHRDSVSVVEPPESMKAAIEAYKDADAKINSDLVSDSDLLAHLKLVDSLHGTILRGPAGRGEDMRDWGRVGGLVVARNKADSLQKDTSVAIPDQLAALRAYVDSATAVRGGHGPTIAADISRIKELDPARVGTVLRAGVCPARCDSDVRHDSLFARGANAGIFIRYLSGTSGSLKVEWRRNGLPQGATAYTADQNRTGYRIWDQKNARDPGNWEVRVLNAKKQLVFRHPFVVK